MNCVGPGRLDGCQDLAIDSKSEGGWLRLIGLDGEGE